MEFDYVYMLIFASLILILGILEKVRLRGNMKKIPLRIHVNGIRGKSTVTRLITGILKEAGKKVVGKTTGTSARMIYWDTPEEKPIERGLQGPNISEQKRVMNEVVQRGADSLVTECMAVNPEYQQVFEDEFVQANITVITNVIEDHLDLMGPSLDDIAEALSGTIPYNGHLIISDSPYNESFMSIAEKRNTKVIIADEAQIDEEYLKKFPYMIFPQNAALALAVAHVLEIDEETALQGMLNAQPDPGAMRVHQFGPYHSPTYFFNGFAANDPTSTLNIWKRINTLDYPTDHATVIMNCRNDRVDRTIQFAKDVLPYMNVKNLVVMGKSVTPITKAYDAGKLNMENFFNMEDQSIDDIIDLLLTIAEGSVIYGIGNIHGGGEELAAAIEKQKWQLDNEKNSSPEVEAGKLLEQT
ncbi:poly-gamma-glutamate synthase PgsB/CapB [Evansella vedderi]|uniref:Poly-gamma-glutamate synthase PgsB/CapB n=1 Tax=Evansella vedderi TaxID=38282 RepID=A0ABT9ZT81_9BACI|nr:poly-gamma-glutamate synthase PgsB [Evansella vedderi]MDQ0254443.1 poly-gamma-glutamate synthase PgsB/CapB [Evansella vedderi]